MVDVFICHSHWDVNAGQALEADLRRLGYRTWRDENMSGGTDWWNAITENIRAAQVFLFAVSADSVRSRVCTAELNYAVSLVIPVVPVQIGDVWVALNPVLAHNLLDYRQPNRKVTAALRRSVDWHARNRPPFPAPLPRPPVIPYENVEMMEGVARSAVQLPAEEQAVLLDAVRKLLADDPSDKTRYEILGLLHALQRRPDTTDAVLLEVNSTLGRLLDPLTESFSEDGSGLTVTNRSNTTVPKGPPNRAAEPRPATRPGPARQTIAVSGVFISYRTDDARVIADRLYQRLLRSFGEHQVFLDRYSIDLGLDFPTVLERRLNRCNVTLVIIGERWLNCADSGGNRRIDDPDDYVRFEVATALARPGMRVIPILVDGAKLPRAEELPGALSALARRQALRVSRADFDADAVSLLSALTGVDYTEPTGR
jgi:hypothetical protein